MSLANYNDLITSVTGHLRRSDLTAQIPDFIAMGEARLNRKLRLLQQEAVSALSAPTASRFLDFPADFLEVIGMSLTVSGSEQALYPVAADKMDAVRDTASGIPQYYRIGSQIEFDRPADFAYPISMRMLRRWNLASDSTNWLMTNCPDCYIYAALIAASPYIKDDARLMTWREMLVSAIDEANELDSRTRADTILTTDAGMSAGSSFNVYSGQ